MKRTIRLLSMFFALQFCFITLLACNVTDQNVQKTEEESSIPNDPAIPYEIFYDSYGANTCYVIDIKIYEGEMPITIEIPEVAPDGKTVIGYCTDALAFQRVPRLILAEDFVAHIQKPLEEAMENGDISYYLREKLLGNFQKISLADAKIQRAKDQMLWDYPLTAVTDLYELFYDTPTADRVLIETYLKEYAGYSIEQHVADIDHLAQVAKENGIDQSIPPYPNNTDRVIGISLPDSLTILNKGMFGGCVNVIEVEDGVSYVDGWALDVEMTKTSISLREGTVGIGRSAFSNCDALESVTLPDSLKVLGSEAFQGCDGIEEINIPGSVTQIGTQAFADCSNLKRVVISEGVTEVHYKAFSGCINLTDITFPESLKCISSHAFDSCQSLTKIHIPKNVTTVYDNPFSDCKALESITVDPENTHYYSQNNCLLREDHVVISGCKNSVIPTDGNIPVIGEDAFAGCEGLTSIVIPDGVETIGSETFVGCIALSSLVLPKSVTAIGHWAFDQCKSLSAVYYGGSPEDWGQIKFYTSNESLIETTRYYYSETQPTEAGNYWRYVEGIPTAW